jgi:recombination associated protein RdgC
MFFKNLNVYRMGESIDRDRLVEFLDANPFTPCLKSQERSAGFTEVVGLNERVFTVSGRHLFCLMVEEKKVPPAAIKTALNKEVQERERKEDRRLKRDEKKALKEEIKARLIVHVPPQAKETWAYIDGREKILVINSSSRKTGDAIAQAIRGAMDTGILYPLKPQHEVSKRMTFWVGEDKAPEPFDLGQKCTIGDGDSTIGYRNRDLSDEKLQEYLTNNLFVSELALSMDERNTFTLTEDFMIKEFTLTDVAMTDHDAGTGEPMAILQADLILMSDEVNRLLKDLLNSLGGEASGEEIEQATEDSDALEDE